MKQITFNIPDEYADVISVTFVGTSTNITNVAVKAYDISKIDKDVINVEVGQE